MLFRKSLAGLIIVMLLFPLFPSSIWALSTGVVSAESYPGKMDIKNVNGLGKNLSNDYFGGAMAFSYPFAFPSGSRGMTPSLGLSYSSNNSDAFSPYGYGFSLSAPRIQRSAKKGVSELYTGDEFVFGGQDLIRETGKSSQFRSKDLSDMSLYTRTASGGWIVTLPDGKSRIFGNIPMSRIADPADATHSYAWLLDEERDQFGHAVKYQYIMDGGQPYLSLVSYGFDATGLDPMYQIRFDYITKGASLTSYRTQFEITTKKLLSKVTLIAGGTSVRGYEFTYDSPNTPISHLTSIAEFGAGGEKLPNISLSYGSGQYQHMVVGVDNHRGGLAQFQYAPSTGYRTGSGTLQNSALPFVVQTLSKKVLTDTVTGISSTENYSYGSGNYYYDSTDIWGREYVGFARVSIRDNKTDKTLYFHQSQTASPDPLKYQDHIAKKGRPYLTEIRDIISGKLLSRELTRYDMRMIGARWLVFPLYKISSMFDSDGSHADTAVSYVIDDMGNTIRETQNGWVTANLDTGTFTDIPGDSITTDRTYISNVLNNLYGFISTEQTTGFSGELMSSSRVEYDNTSTGVTLGLPTAKVRIDTITGDTVRDTTAYSPRGLPIEKVDPLGNKTILSYDDLNIALTRETNPLGWKVEYDYNYALGKPITTKNQNDIITKTTYDIFGRELSRSRVVDGSETLLMSRSYDDASIPNIATETTYFTTDGDSKVSRGYTDGWGRTIMTTTSTEKVGQYSVSQVRYDDDGNPIYAGYPVFASSPNWDIGLVFSGVTDGEVYRNRYPGVSYRYDPLGRIVSQRDARGVTTKSYTPRSETITNALGAITRGNRDAYGNLISYVENISGRDLTTSYSYDALSRPVGLRDTLANIRNWEYDGLGGLKRATDTHSIGDATYGIRQYAYDIIGRLTEYTNAKGEKITYTYDTLSRLKKESYPTTGSGVFARDYTYDIGTRSLGTLSSVVDPSTTVSYTYDPIGRKTGETRTMENKSYTLGYEYNITSILTRIIYPDGGKTDYKYARGYVEGVDYTDPIGNLTHLITDISYTPNSTMQSVRYGNGVVKNTTRDADHNYRLTRSTATLSGSTLLDTEYHYDAISNIDKIKENGIEPLRKSIDYTYDALARLTRADYVYSVAGYNRTNTPYSYTYDDIGNITDASNIGSYGYSGLGYANPHAVTTAGDTTYAYDEAGQMSSRTSPGMILSFAYSPYGEMTSSVKNGETTTYAYDQSRRRILKSTLGLTEHHIIDGYEVEYESGAVVEVQNNAQQIIQNEGTGNMSTGSTESGTTNSGVTQTGSTDSGSINTGSGESGTGATGTGEILISTGSTNSGSTSSGTESTGSTDTGSIVVTETGSTNTGETNTGSTETGSTNSGEVVSNSGTTESGSYMIIAGYEASTMSGATPITLVITLTHIMLGDERIATFQTQTDDSIKSPDDDKLVYHIADHLNSSSLDLSSTGLVLQAVDYLPFGKSNTYELNTKRVKGKKGGYTNKYQFANKQLDSESDLQYFEKRYYDNRIGRFTTEDPVYWEVGLTNRPNQYVTDPQQWNSYSYVRNNPINLVDPSGETIDYSKTETDVRPKGSGKSYYQATNFSLEDADSHYNSNNGTAIRVSFNEIDTSFITPETFDVIRSKIDAEVPGTYEINTTNSRTTVAIKDYKIFGDLTFKTEGILKIENDGRWSYQGILKSFDDIYDFTISEKDKSSPSRWGRNIVTYLLDKHKYGQQGTSYSIQITGEKPLTGISYGTATPVTSQGSSTNGVISPKIKVPGRANLSRGPLLN